MVQTIAIAIDVTIAIWSQWAMKKYGTIVLKWSYNDQHEGVEYTDH